MNKKQDTESRGVVTPAHPLGNGVNSSQPETSSHQQPALSQTIPPNHAIVCDFLSLGGLTHAGAEWCSNLLSEGTPTKKLVSNCFLHSYQPFTPAPNATGPTFVIPPLPLVPFVGSVATLFKGGVTGVQMSLGGDDEE